MHNHIKNALDACTRPGGILVKCKCKKCSNWKGTGKKEKEQCQDKKHPKILEREKDNSLISLSLGKIRLPLQSFWERIHILSHNSKCFQQPKKGARIWIAYI